MEGKQSMKLNNLFFYGVSFAEYDSVDVSRDIITNIRMRFLVSGKSASNKLYRSSGDDSFVYSYNFTNNRPLQWRVVKNKRTVEEIEHLFSEKYCINYYDSKGHDIKKVFFDSKHRWFKTNYYNTVSNESLTCSLVPKEFDEGTSILKYMTGAVYPERLYPCSLPSCAEVRTRVLDRISTPTVTALTNRGTVFFMTEEDKENYEKILSEEEERFAGENAPEVYVSADEAKGGFNLDIDAFDMSKNLNLTLDISMAEDFIADEAGSARITEESEPEKLCPEEHIEVISAPVEESFEIPDDGTVDAAITGVVYKINSLTSLDINADEILNIDISGLTSEENKTEPHQETEAADDSDPAMDAQLRHIDSVLDGTSLLNSDRKLVIGESVVDEDYISSIIDGIISSAFSADDEVAGISESTETEAEKEEAESLEESETEGEVTAEIHEDEITESTDSDNADEAREPQANEFLFAETTDSAETETSYNQEREETDSETDTDEFPEEHSGESLPEADGITEAVHESEINDNVPFVATAEDYIKETPADVTIESRGEAYYYYGSVDENGKRSGRGRTLMSDGSIAYEGEYCDDKRKGQGSFYFKDGTLCYWGNWDDNVRSGFGVGVSSDDKAVHAGNWADNKPVGLGIRFDSEGNLMFISSSCEDKKKGFTISDFSDTSFTVRAWSEKDEAFIQREISIRDIIK